MCPRERWQRDAIAAGGEDHNIIMCAVMAALTTAPAPMVIDSDGRVQLHQWTVELVNWWYEAWHGLDLGDCALWLPLGWKNSREETLGFDNGHSTYGDGDAG